jgi:hypothetical protein
MIYTVRFTDMFKFENRSSIRGHEGKQSIHCRRVRILLFEISSWYMILAGFQLLIYGCKWAL